MAAAYPVKTISVVKPAGKVSFPSFVFTPMIFSDSDLFQRTALVTGSASGLGLCAARGLARRGAHVFILDRNIANGEAAVRDLRTSIPNAKVDFRALDLGDLAAIRAFAESFRKHVPVLDLLINNAGLLPPLQRATTVDGFELGFGVSVMGHYALTGLLMPALLRSPSPRVISVSSIVYPTGQIDFDDLHLARNYEPNRAYASAKLGSMLFSQELQRHAQAARSHLLSVVAHPGISRTNIGAGWKSAPSKSVRDWLAQATMDFAMRWLGQDAEQGAEPFLLAATDTAATGGAFYGPGGWLQFTGPPSRLELKPAALNHQQATMLWASLERLTGLTYSWTPMP